MPRAKAREAVKYRPLMEELAVWFWATFWPWFWDKAWYLAFWVGVLACVRWFCVEPILSELRRLK